MTIFSTICWIIKNNKALLKLASKGISKGKWNAPGGKLNSGESPLECVVREVYEEVGLKIEKPRYHGMLNFFFGNRIKPKWIVHIFSTNSFVGKVKESKEGKLKWFDINNLPFANMWEDDKHWLPFLFQGKKFVGNFYFEQKGKKLLDFSLREIA